MVAQLQSKKSTGGDEVKLPIKFIALCVFAFIGSVAATIYFCYSMNGEMDMPWRLEDVNDMDANVPPDLVCIHR